MRGAAANIQDDPRFELPPQFAVSERRIAGQAIDRWRSGGKALVTGFDSHSLIVIDPAGMATIEYAGDAIAATFGLGTGMRLEGRGGLAAEVRAACDLIAIDPQPVPFEFSLTAPDAALIMGRGVALTIAADATERIGAGAPVAEPRQIYDRVQIVINWREMLDRAAMARLRRELGTALRLVPSILAKADPFFVKTGV
ncbi:MAG: hypothetical protein H7268_03570 [Sandarakinorhabdus sp.]|nr:hypothetical protein [Sandarakinorhabdus sp.]